MQQSLHREPTELPPDQPRDLRLIEAEHGRGLLLRPTRHELGDLSGQPRLGPLLLSVGAPEVRKDIPAPNLEFDPINLAPGSGFQCLM